MIKKGVVNPNPRSQVLTDLTALIKTKRRPGCEIMLMMDVNNDNSPGTQWGKFTKDNTLYNVHKTLVSQRPATTRYNSNIIIDFMLTSKRILCYAWVGEYGAFHK